MTIPIIQPPHPNDATVQADPEIGLANALMEAAIKGGLQLGLSPTQAANCLCQAAAGIVDRNRPPGQVRHLWNAAVSEMLVRNLHQVLGLVGPRSDA